MNKDIRLNTGFWDHWKTVVLVSDLGLEAAVSLQRLWCFAAQFKPEGRLTGMSIKAIEVATHWSGKQGVLIEKLMELGFIEQDSDSTYAIHDWLDWNGYAAHAQDRSEQSKIAAEVRWKGRAKRPSKTKADAHSNAHSNAHSSAPVPVPVPFPIPTPSPDPTCPAVEVLSKKGRLDPVRFARETEKIEPEPNQTDRTDRPTDRPIDDKTLKKIITLYHELLPMCPPVNTITPALTQQIAERLVEDLPIDADGFPPFYLWQLFFTDIATRSPLLTGQLPPAEGFRKRFVATLEWLTQTENYQAIEAKKYFDSPRKCFPAKGNGEDHVHQQH